MYLDIFIVVAFCVLTLWSGFGHGRSVKTITQYAVGDRDFSTVALVSTLVATRASSSAFSNSLRKTYEMGIIFPFIVLFSVVVYWVSAFVFLPRMKRFLEYNSIAHAVGKICKSNIIRIIIALTGTMKCMGLIAVQFKIFGIIISYFTNMYPTLSIIICGAVVTIYSSSGGIKAVTFTDVVQFTIFALAIPIIAIIIWNHLYLADDFSVIDGFKHPKFNPFVALSFNNPKFVEMIPVMLYFGFPRMSPTFSQRILMGDNIFKLKRVFFISGLTIAIFLFLLNWIPFLLYTHNPALDSSQLLPYVIDNYTYPGLKGLLIAGIFALAMSTADSSLNSSAVMISNDVFRPLNISRGNELSMAKKVSAVLGFLSIILATSEKDLLSIVLFTASFYIPISTTPIILTILGFKTSPRVIITAMVTSFIFVIVWKFVLEIKYDVNVIGAVFNGILIFAIHYIFRIKGGWIEVEGYREYKEVNAKKWKKRWENVVNFNLLKYVRTNAPDKEIEYVFLGIYFICFAIGNMYFANAILFQEHERLMLGIYQIILITGTLFVAHPIWPKEYISFKTKLLVSQFLWYVTIFYQMILFPTFFLLINEFSNYYVIVLAVNTVSVPILIGWRLALGMIPVGIIGGVILCKLLTPDIIILASLGSSPAAVIVYVFILIGIALITFIRFKQQNYEILVTTEAKQELELKVKNKEIQSAYATKERLFANFQHEFNIPMNSLLYTGKILSEEIGTLKETTKEEMITIYLENYHRLKSLSNNVLSIATKSYMENKSLKKEKFSVSDLIHDIVNGLSIIYNEIIQKRNLIFNLDFSKDVYVVGDKYHLSQVIDNLVMNAIFYSKNSGGKISIFLEKYIKDKSEFVRFTIEDEGVGFDLNESYRIFELFTEGNRTKSKAKGRGVGLTLCKSVINAHGGSIKATPLPNGARFTFIIPAKPKN